MKMYDYVVLLTVWKFEDEVYANAEGYDQEW